MVRGGRDDKVGGGWEEGLPHGERTGSPSSLVEVGGGREDWIGRGRWRKEMGDMS